MKPIQSVTFLLLFVITSCAAVNRGPISEEKTKPINTIGVISLLGDDFMIEYVGLTIFNNYVEKAGVKDWDLDRYATELIRDEITKKTKMTFIPVAYDSKVISAGDIKDAAAKTAKNSELDALILITTAPSLDPVMHEKKVTGFGLFQRSIAIMKDSALFLAANATIYRVSNMEALGEMYISAGNQIDNSFFKKDFSQVSQEQKDYMQKWIKDTLDQKLKTGLRHLAITAPEAEIIAEMRRNQINGVKDGLGGL